jgi:hypothetical protein
MSPLDTVSNMHQELDNVQHNIRRLRHQVSQIFWGIGVKLKT